MRHDRAGGKCGVYLRGILLPEMTPHDHPGRTHLFGEVGGRPHGADLRVESGGERVVVERPLVPVDHLRRLTGANIHQLGQIDLEGAAVVTE